jgi:hypothetical protein
MSACAVCGTELQGNMRFCSACGSPVGSDDLATLDFAPSSSAPRSARPASASSSRPPSSSPGYALNEGRFLPGRLLASRYRIIALLGKGGMGEVYRADDLTLGQPVALKFLPEEATREESLLERFRNEVRMARRVSHPNVCRVYDVGEVEGNTYFTMEYVDGEDLGSLLRRIGRLPQDKALDMARQLCAGLAAAHAKGVLHRDLKPANVMLDGRGQVVITDFGLSGLIDQFQGAEIRSGTPAYMAPEQLAGKEVTVKSDIYALGLVLYEIFTGKGAFTSSTPAELLRNRGDRTPSRPSTVVRDLDPAVERVILRCLEVEPASRPVSALSVAAALPGGDPLAAALAAGETPSPQLVAAAGETAGLRPRVAATCLAVVLAGLALMLYLNIRYNPLEKMGVEQPPEALTQKAHEMVARLGYEGRPADTSFGLSDNSDFTDYVEKNDKPHPRWDDVLSTRPALLNYWYRQSPQYMVPSDFRDLLLTPGIMTRTDPPTVLSGMINLELDPQGRLINFQAIPPQKENTSAHEVPVDWNILFTSAGLDLSKFQTTEPNWVSLAASDTRMAWTGIWPGSTRPLRVEAAAFHGKPVFFSLIGDWTKPHRVKSSEVETISQKVSKILLFVLLSSLIACAIFLAFRNYRRGRGDRAGAFRLASIMFGLEMALWLVDSHLVPTFDTFGLCVIAVSTALFLSGLTWVLYLALEPWIRRHWPQTIISWSRLLSGRGRDPLVGRDILFGVILGVIWILIFEIRAIPLLHMGASPGTFSLAYLLGGRQALGAWLAQIPSSIIGTLQFFFLLLGLKLLLRKSWLAAIVFVAIFAVPHSLQSSYMKVEMPAQILIYTIAVIVVFRFGLVPLAIGIFTVNMLVNVPFSADLSVWYMSTSILALLSVVALAGWGFYHSLGGQSLWRPELE